MLEKIEGLATEAKEKISEIVDLWEMKKTDEISNYIIRAYNALNELVNCIRSKRGVENR